MLGFGQLIEELLKLLVILMLFRLTWGMLLLKKNFLNFRELLVFLIENILTVELLLLQLLEDGLRIGQ